MYLPIFSRQLWSPVAMRSRIKFSGGVNDWIVAGGWSIALPVTKKGASLFVHDSDHFAEAMINDAMRLSTAAFESARAVGVYGADPRSFAWQFISYYYAAYFAANALMRLCGYSCTNFSSVECTAINEIASLCGEGGSSEKSKISPGVFFTSLNTSGSATWSLSSVSSKGGVHIQFWTGFLKFLLELRSHIVSSSLPKTDRDAAIDELDKLIGGLKHSGAQTGAWLSEVRNAMNYRLEYGAWYPYSNAETDGDNLLTILKSAIDDSASLPQTSQVLSSPVRATRITSFMLSWLRLSLVTLAASTSGSKRKAIFEGPLLIASKIG